MNALLKLKQPPNAYEIAMQQWLSGGASGHLGPHMYTNDNDDNRWKDGHSADTYYLGHDDKATFDAVLKDFNITATSLIDLGPGGEISIDQKTIPLIQALKSQNYYPIDLSETLAQNALKRVEKALNISGQSIVTDFFDPLPIQKPNTLLAIMGGTIGNIETCEDPQILNERLSQIFAGYKKAAHQNGYFLVSFDANSNVKEILACYQNKEFGGLVRSCIERSINTDGFDYDVVWNAKNYQLATGLRSRCDQIIKFNGEEFAIEQDEFLSVLNSYRFPVSFLKEAAMRAGWKHQKTWTVTGRMHYLLFS